MTRTLNEMDWPLYAYYWEWGDKVTDRLRSWPEVFWGLVDAGTWG